MANNTPITIIGNLTADPEIRFPQAGGAVANFNVAVTPRSFDRQSQQWVDGTPTFYRCAAWRQLGENVAETFTKGMQVIVTGDFTTETYETRDGQERLALNIRVDNCGPALQFASAQVVKNPPRQQGGGQWQGQQQQQQAAQYQQQPQGQQWQQQPPAQQWGNQPPQQQWQGQAQPPAQQQQQGYDPQDPWGGGTGATTQHNPASWGTP